MLVGAAIIYATSFFPREFKRSPWRFLMQIEASNMLYIPFGAMSLAAFLVDMTTDNAGRLVDIGFVDLLAIVFVPLLNVYIVDRYHTIWGMILVGCVGGMTMTTFPIYISELSSPTARGAFVSTIFLQITGGKILYYLNNLYSSVKKDQTWNWKLGIVPGIIHVIVLLAGGIPESPRWLYRKGYKKEAVEILNTLRSPCEVSKEVKAMQLSMEAEIAKEGSIDDHGGGGFNSPSDDEMTEQAALAIPLITSVLCVVGTIFCIVLVDRCGRRKLLLISIFGIMVSLG
ncbi:probable inositol transporter 2 isoform X2 [Papaver somniferum]|uniref:probable inositol transporter 2 isoform X2 n=1 Tax=Papaver somniferum TaxID=3469 RepID=UPI000E6F8208|nr:probable inositol transporter 2 isoform X2 [Papaver somniferum]